VICRRCDRPASHKGYFVDLNKRGVNLNEPGYTLELLCQLHGAKRRQEVTARVEELTVDERHPELAGIRAAAAAVKAMPRIVPEAPRA
jgi:hypothetical protein